MRMLAMAGELTDAKKERELASRLASVFKVKRYTAKSTSPLIHSSESKLTFAPLDLMFPPKQADQRVEESNRARLMTEREVLKMRAQCDADRELAARVQQELLLRDQQLADLQLQPVWVTSISILFV